jgi:mannose-6-phosphate isomerase-like protein (cupin superfamily)
MSDHHNAGGSRDDAIFGFLTACTERLAARADTPAADVAATALQLALARSTPLEFEPNLMQALNTLDLVDEDGLGENFIEVAPLLHWTPTQRADDGGVDLALAPLDVVRDLGELTVGIMYVRPHRQYPLHHHPPHEVYLTISGEAQWRFGGHDDFRPIGRDVTIYNHPGDLHSAIAGDTPLVALYVLWPDTP